MIRASLERVFLLLFAILFILVAGHSEAAESSGPNPLDYRFEKNSTFLSPEALVELEFNKKLDERVSTEKKYIDNYLVAYVQARREQIQDRAAIAQQLLIKEAAARNRSVDQLIRNETEEKISPITEKDVDELLEEAGAPIDSATERQFARDALSRERRDRYYREFIDHLFLKYGRSEQQPKIAYSRDVQRALEGPDSPHLGDSDAKETFILFANPNSPFSADLYGSLKNLLLMNDHSELVVRFIVDEEEPAERDAAIGAFCANKQGKFWAYQDLLFKDIYLRESHDLIRFAGETSLDIDPFLACQSSEEAALHVSVENTVGRLLDLRYEPVLYLNGIQVDPKAILGDPDTLATMSPNQ